MARDDISNIRDSEDSASLDNVNKHKEKKPDGTSESSLIKVAGEKKEATRPRSAAVS